MASAAAEIRDPCLSDSDEGIDSKRGVCSFLSLFLRLFLPMDLKDAASMRKYIANSNLACKDVLKVNTAVCPGIYEMDFTYDSDGTLSAVALKEISYSFKENYWPVSAS